MVADRQNSQILLDTCEREDDILSDTRVRSGCDWGTRSIALIHVRLVCHEEPVMVRFDRLFCGFRVVSRLLVPCGCLLALVSTVFSAEPVAATAATPSGRGQQVADHLAAGEFGPAMTQALAAPVAAERATLLKQVAKAQQEVGDTEAAAGTLRRLPAGEDRAKSKAELQGSAGGGAQADFQTLMRLIQQSTVGPPSNAKWVDIDGDGGTMSPYQNGVRVAPGGLLSKLSGEELTGSLASLGIQARQADLNGDVAQRSDMRMVSLTRLERSVAQRIEEGLPIPETMMQLAGLSQIKFVFVFPETNDIVVAGPASGWMHNAQGQSVSTSNGRPTLQLDDLVTVLRTFARGEADFGCSINTRDEGVKALKEFVEKSQAKGAIGDGAVRSWVKQIQQKLGRQDVVVWGVPADSRVARVIVEADYRMKLIGVNRLDAGKEIPGYFDLLPVAQQKIQPNMDALRWWLTLQCDAVLHSNDKNVFEIQGSSVLCQSENQLITADGKHVPTGQSEPTNRLFAQNFTANYAKLAKKDLVFADAENVFDMALCSALIKHEGLTGRVGWNYGVFAPDGAYAPASFAVPTEVESVVNHRVYRGRDIVVQAAGGVRCNVMTVAKDANRNKLDAELDTVGNTAKAPRLPEGRWWWDITK